MKNNKYTTSEPTFAILYKESGKVIEGLTIDNVSEGVRDRKEIPNELRDQCMGNLVTPGGITFVTPAGKKWHMKFHEFSFVERPAA